MRRVLRIGLGAALLALPGLLLASSSRIDPPADPLRARIAAAQAEARAAGERAAELERQAAKAGEDAARLQAGQLAAAEAIAAAEAEISAADSRVQLAARMIAERRRRLDTAQQPVGSLLAGLALMASRPPLMALLDERSTSEFVEVRLLLDSTLPEIRRRTAALRQEVERGRRLEAAALAARSEAAAGRHKLDIQRKRFAALEQQALQTVGERIGEAMQSSDLAMARGEQAERLTDQSRSAGSARQSARALALLPPPPARPGSAAAEAAPLPGYRLPADAAVVEGFGTVAANGVKSRGIRLATARGARLVVPADGIVRFSGPFRRYDGVVIIEHGDGWRSLLVNASSPIAVGSRVSAGQPLGRAIGAIEVELSHRGTRHSPALIAGSSQTLSNDGKAR